jgi:hypothetical protein
MRVEYTCTLDDFREALRANGHLTMSVSMLGWWASIGLLVTLGTAAAATLPNPLPREWGLLALAVTLGPTLLNLSIFAGAALRLLSNLKNPRPTPPLLVYAGWGLAVALLITHWLVARRRLEVPLGSGAAASMLGLLLPTLISMGIFVIIGLLGVWLTDASTQRMWDADITQHRPRLMVVGDGGITVADAVSRHDEAWAAFVRHRETANLLLLYVARSRFYIVPKRAFSDAATLDAFRDMVRSRISPPSEAFPVCPPGVGALPPGVPLAATPVAPPPRPDSGNVPPPLPRQ